MFPKLPSDLSNEELLHHVYQQQGLIEQQMKQNQEQQEQINKLLAQVAYMSRQLFGRKSEKLACLDPNQLSLFDEPSTPLSQVTEAEITQELATLSTSSQAKRTPRKRSSLDNLPVVQEVIEPQGIDKKKYRRIGEEVTRVLEFKPGELYVREIIRPKYGLIDSNALFSEHEKGIQIAPMPALPIPKGLAGASMLAEILLLKYEYHMPFYRQAKQFKHLGMYIAQSTMNDWYKACGELLYPLYGLLKRQILSSNYIQVDETTLPVINKERKVAAKEYLWVTRDPIHKQVFFHYDDGSRSGQALVHMLKGYKGYLQSDGYNAYDLYEEDESIHLVACLAHIRRMFEKSLDNHREQASYALAEIQKLYRIERSADKEDLSDAARYALRLKLSKPILDNLEQWLEQTYNTVLPKSLLGKAIKYTYGLWPRMKTFLAEGFLRIDNNQCENAIRPIAISRKNFLFCGNHDSAEHTAVICSFLSSCKELQVNPRVWLQDVLSRLPELGKDADAEKLKELLPLQWSRSHPEHIQESSKS